MLQRFRILKALPRLVHTYVHPTQSITNKQHLISSHNIMNFEPKSADTKFILPDYVKLVNHGISEFKTPTVSTIVLSQSITLPYLPNAIPIKMKNDIKIRRRKMKRHQKKRLHKRHAVLIRKEQMMREKKEESKLQQLLEFWKIRSESWDPVDKVKNRLHLARRSGYYEPEGRLHTKDLSNPIHASKCGQEALQDMLSGLRDLMLLFYACMDPKTRGVSTHQASIAGPQCVETLQHMKSNKELLQQAFHVVKESCDRLLPADVSDLVPYVDTPIMNREPSLELKQLIIAREKVIKRLLTVTEELEKLRRILTKTVWELNDLTDLSIQKF
ncbi:unnamed protein product [Schistosoma mattheei]|uniref:Uncharacterized protein n=1 Tax=Schistosoma mattheei TaxID=31246 RepID=A0A183PDY0_9TREM|nr:unnamed protein product [Schistosoma mattheei]